MKDTTVITEKFSENKERKRGRPKAFSDEIETTLEAIGIFEEVHTRRSRINRMNRTRAIHALKDYPEFKWLVDHEACKRGDKGAWKPTILAELGRIKNPDGMRDVAGQICELKPKVKEAVVLIRRYRIGQWEPKENQLEDEICNLLEDFRMRYPIASHQSFIDALDFSKKVIDSIFNYEKVSSG